MEPLHPSLSLAQAFWAVGTAVLLTLAYSLIADAPWENFVRAVARLEAWLPWVHWAGR